MNRRRHLGILAACIAVSLISGCESAPEVPVDLARIHDADDFRAHLTAFYGEIPLTINPQRNRFYLDVFINGVPGKFLLDTGAESSFIHRSALGKFGLTAQVSGESAAGIGGGVAVRKAEFDSFLIGGKIAITPGDFNVLMDGNPADFDGVIGMNLLHRLHVAVDFRNDRFYFTPPDTRFSATLEEVAGKAGLHAMELTAGGGKPYLAARVNGEPGNFLLDTGFSHSVLDEIFARNLALETRPIPGNAFGFGEKTFARAVCRPDTITIGDFTWNKPMFVVTDLGEIRRRQHRVSGIAGVIGVDFLVQNRAILDLDNFRAYFEVPGRASANAR